MFYITLAKRTDIIDDALAPNHKRRKIRRSAPAKLIGRAGSLFKFFDSLFYLHIFDLIFFPAVI